MPDNSDTDLPQPIATKVERALPRDAVNKDEEIDGTTYEANKPDEPEATATGFLQDKE